MSHGSEIDYTRSDGIEQIIFILDFEEDHCIYWALFDDLEESILCRSSCRIKVPENIDIFSFIGHQIDIYDTFLYRFYIEFFFILWDIVYENVGYICLDEILI